MTDWTAASIAKALHRAPRKSGTNWMTLCPAHADKGFSLSLRDKSRDHVIVNCLAGCDFRDIIKALHDRNIQLPSGRSNFKATAVKSNTGKARPAPPPEPVEEEKKWIHAPDRACECAFELKSLGRIAKEAKAVYEWRDKKGELQLYTIRFQRADGTKNVLPVTPCVHVDTKELQWRLQGPDGMRPFYNRENDRDQPIVLVLEGEKTADAGKLLFASQENVWVTTTLGGCKSPHLVDWSPMKGRKIVIAHDIDAAGLTYAATVSANSYEAGATSCQLLTLRADEIISAGVPRLRNSDFSEGYDMADALEEKWTLPLLLNQNRPWHGPQIIASL
jgi:hypothetical protein